VHTKEDKEDIKEYQKAQVLKDYRDDKKAFAQEVVINGRKSDQMLYPTQWSNPGCL
jgi:hypothetical protein